jgi:prepilin peptidase CpaA
MKDEAFMFEVVLQSLLVILLPVMLIAASWIDLKQHRIPNLLTFSLLISGILLQFLLHGWEGLIYSLGGLAVGFLIFIPFYIKGGMGAGDVKLMAATGAFLGFKGALLAIGLTLFAGSVMGIFLLVILGGIKTAMHRYYATLKQLLYTHNINMSYIPPPSDEAAAVKFPYASAICLGTIAAMWYLSMFSDLTKQLAGF